MNLHLYRAELSSSYWSKDTISLLFWVSGMSPITSTTGAMNRTKRRGPRTEPCGTPVSELSLTAGWGVDPNKWWTICQVSLNPGVDSSRQAECMFKPVKEGGVVQSVKSSRHIESSKNCDLSRINGVHDVVSQFEQSCFCRIELSICRLKGWKTGRNGKVRKEASQGQAFQWFCQWCANWNRPEIWRIWFGEPGLLQKWLFLEMLF